MTTRRPVGDFVLADTAGCCTYCGEATVMLETGIGELLHVGRCTRARFREIDDAGAGCDNPRCEPDDCVLDGLPLILRPFRCTYRAATRR